MKSLDSNISLGIDVYRIIFSFSIILCHIFTFYGGKFGFLGQIFNVGIYVFILISGILYGINKRKHKYIQWIFKRYLKIVIPMQIMITFYILFSFYDISCLISKNLYTFYLNIQGFFNVPIGTGHLWFVTVIFLCYLITPLVYKCDKKINLSLTKICFLQLILILFLIILNQAPSKVFNYFLIILFYVYAMNINIEVLKKYHCKKFLFTLGVILCIRIFSSLFFTSDSLLYVNFIVPITHIYLSLFLLSFLTNIANLFKSIDSKQYSYIKKFSELSFYVYLVHYIFIEGRFSLMLNNFILDVFIVTALSLCIGFCLQKISVIFTNLVERLFYGFKNN